MAGFEHAIAGGQGKLITTQLQSPDFDLATETGWAILKNGDAYFFNLTAAGSITTNTVVVKGSGDGVFVYDGIPGPGTLVVAIASMAGTDGFGNDYSGPGIAVSAAGAAGKNEIQIRPDLNAVLIYTP
jgi:hypothetical protein